MYFEYATRIPEVIRWLIRHTSCQSPDLAALYAAIRGGLKSFWSLQCSGVLAFTPRCALSKGRIIPGGHTFPHFTRRSSIRSITGGLFLRRCSFSSDLSAFAPPVTTIGKPITAFPFILQNVHRYFLYVAVLFLIFLWHDAFRSFFFDSRFGVGVGSIVLTLNVTLLTLYTFSCHSLRHLRGFRRLLRAHGGLRRDP